ncbi:integrase [Komagataeibacter oboediens]|uniref:integrase n=1 Tax=Komagataeibacter oboediens TaxID=65958 RepID=UPI000493D9E2|nr:integrase [Komagataeibacter oboediens]
MLQIHPQARTTPAVRADIARSSESTSVLARRYGISAETVRKWRRRGSDACQDRSSRPRKLAWKASEEERAIVCHLRRSTGFGLDDLTFVVRHFLPHLNRDNIWRILKDAGLNRLPPAPKTRPVRGQGTFRDYDPGYVHIDVKHLPKLQTADGERRKRFLYVATEVLPVCVSSHKDLEILLRGFCFAYNHRRQRVLGGITPTQCITSWLEKHPAFRNPDHIKPADRDIMKQVDEILDYANDVSQPDS